MTPVLVIVHIVVCIALIMIVLLQTGKGADMGAAFGGGGSQTLFGTTGASTFLGKATTVAAVVFMLTSLCLAYLADERPGSSVMSDVAPPPVEQQAAPAAQEETAPAETARTEAETAGQAAGAATSETPADTATRPAETAQPAAPAAGGDSKDKTE